MTHDEAWASVAGWEGFYSISTLGRVRSEARTVARTRGGHMRVRADVGRQRRVLVRAVMGSANPPHEAPFQGTIA